MQTADAATTQRPNWQPLLGSMSNEFWRGTVFRISSARWPYEEIVDLMCVENSESPSGLSLIVSTGYKAGLILVHLPKESNFRKEARSLSASWLLANWDKWIYSESSVANVLVIPHYPSKVCIEHSEAYVVRDITI